MWVSKPIYESLPYFYLAVGGLVLFLKRRDYRHHDQRGARTRED